MSRLHDLKAAQKLSDLAPILGHKPSALAYLVRKVPPAQKYVSFSILKKNGGIRTIDAPVDKLKQLQRKLADLLYDCQQEIERQRKPRRALSHGFRKNYSIITNARTHTGRRFVLNLDLEEFFPSFNFGRVRGFFIKNQDFSLSPDIGTVIAQIACYNNALPQGSPCSPIISDLVSHILDVRLAKLARLNRCTYSRYADDITFSTNEKTFPKALAYSDPQIAPEWIVGNSLADEITRAGFSINQSKTRMQYKVSLQQVTSLTVNKKVNIRASYYRAARLMCHSLFRRGAYHHEGIALTSVERLEGIVNHTYHVKSTVSAWSAEKNAKGEPKSLKKTLEDPTEPAIQKLYSRLLFFKYFVNLAQPLILSEGKTDSVYLKLAIRHLSAAFPTLAVSKLGPNRIGVDFFKYGGLASKLLKLEGGTSHIAPWIADYDILCRSYQKTPNSPVVVLIDSDSGASPIVSAVNGRYKKSITLKSTAPFHYLCRNLYLVLTPVPLGAAASCIEDFFEKSILDTELSGKKFNPTNFDNSPTEYGKFLFAEYVVRPQAKNINFVGFSDLLTRIAAACADYAAKQSTP